jgi:hypothetical protein
VAQSLKQRHLKRHKALEAERSSWIDLWQDLARHIRPRSGRFLGDRVNDGTRKDGSIVNGRPLQAQRILQAGMMAGITSPSRPWFRLTTPDPRDAERDSVKVWLSKVEGTLRDVLQKANLYRSLHSVYGELSTPGTAVLFVEAHAERLIHGRVVPVGSYALATNAEGVVDTVYRTVRMTVLQMVQWFGKEAVSKTVLDLYNRDELDAWQDVVHCVLPNEVYSPGKLGPTGKKWSSIWFEPNGTQDDKMLRVSGYDEKPLLAPRWEVTGEDVYGHSPGMVALGDCRALQHLERRKAQIIDQITHPPMKGPVSLRNQRVSLLPGEITHLPDNSVGSFEPAYVINPAALPAISSEIQRHEGRVDSAFYADLWLMLAQSDGQMTAREVVERREEKLLQLGPVLESLHGELLSPLIDLTFGACLRAGRLPPPPEELEGQELKVEYLSILAQAQKMLGTVGVERLTGFVTGLAQLNPQAVDKLDVDQAVDEYASMVGVPPSTVRSDDAVEALRAQRAQQMAQQQALEQAASAGQTAKTLAETPMESGNALDTMLRGLGAA